MKLTQTKTELTEVRDVPGIMSCKITHEIKSTSAVTSYIGPKIPKEEWDKVLSFLMWVYDTTKSESQVRLYVNPETKTWKAWAYPQEAKTGMSAKEIQNDESKKQREQFKDSEGWCYFGTVHSHCSASAFQSGTDEANEKDQDGIHITIGKLDLTHFDIHVRFYRNGLKFDPDMSAFWLIGEPWESASADFVNKDKVARYQMCVPPTPDNVNFPDEWKSNLIEIKPTVTTYGPTAFPGYWTGEEDGPLYNPHVHLDSNAPGRLHELPSKHLSKKERKRLEKEKNKELIPHWERMKMAANELEATCKSLQIDESEIMETLDAMASTPVVDIVIKVCQENDITIDDLLQEIQWSPSLMEQSEINRQLGLPSNGQ